MAAQQPITIILTTGETSKARRLAKRLLTGSLVVATCWWLMQHAQAAVELGSASVQSQQGQKLKVLFPYAGNPGERPSINRFSVESATLPDGRTISPRDFSLMAPLDRNAIVVQSRNVVYAQNVQLVMNVSNQRNGRQAFNLNVPASSASAELAPVSPLKKSLKKRGKYSGKPMAKLKAKSRAAMKRGVIHRLSHALD